MSKSRLEKFLYALYSLDSSDLPNPLSRIEELYKCLVTSDEAPTFEPISRVEKYLMVILGGYDVELLPNPLSRVEVLLYKLATGDDNLDDVEVFLSEHEELLAEIIRNGGAGGNIDIEYVLCTLLTEFNTLYNTAEKPVKSAILSGNTLVNLVPSNYSIDIQGITTAWQHLAFLCLPNKGSGYNVESLQSVKSNTKYLLRFYVERNTVNNKFALNNPSSDSVFSDFVGVNAGETGWFNFILTSKEIVNESVVIRFQNATAINGDIKVNKIMLIEYVEGMEDWDIPYFEGMQSVKMPVLTTTGKNLIDLDKVETNSFNGNVITKINNGFKVVTSDTSMGWNQNIKISLNVEKNTTYVYSVLKNVIIDTHPDVEVKWGTGYTFIKGVQTGTVLMESSVYDGIRKNIQFNTKENEEIYIYHCAITDDKPKSGEYELVDLQMIKGSDNDTYEPYKSNILSCNEDVTLRSNGDVYDELNLLTGRLTQRIDENNEVLGQEVVKTVDLSVVDQDGKDTKLKTFNDITYVTLSSEGLIPEAELEVATKNEEVLNTLSLEMDYIFTAQTTLEETSNTQSENIDSTMIATTEIYDGLL